MKRIYSSHSPLLVGHMRNVLEAHGIRCATQNMDLIGGAGELPPIAVWPELWVEREIDYGRAEQLVEQALADTAGDGPDWRCPGCGETLEVQFDECWNCGTRKPAQF